ncbi:lipase family protein [Williamsia sp. CHRR-6]|uniref:lipase family protein n=1 Tax=Williamsia sp. CHRR-6 TaxID=2835871 RepID=UPI001BDAA485|nr:lipase family protein [Williamsia sp. CHRR-6]MBT0566949.1 lipase [Williamsia sp. CHRR-6]
MQSRARQVVLALIASAVTPMALLSPNGGPAQAAPIDPLPPPIVNGLQAVVGPPPIPKLKTIPPIAYTPGLSHSLMELRAAMLPPPVGDPFFDVWPANLASYKPGEIIGVREVTKVARTVINGSVTSVRQFKFRTTDSFGLPSFGTASVLTPTTAWAGPGPRPILLNDQPIVSLGTKCNPGYSFSHGAQAGSQLDNTPPATKMALAKGYTVVLPDYQGPRMAYGEPVVAGHITLDSVRALARLEPTDFAKRKIAVTGYSGGSIAVNGTVKLVNSYAPELKKQFVGAVLGGTPANFKALIGSMNGNLATGVLTAAVMGITREHPELLARTYNNPALWVGTSEIYRNACNTELGYTGAAFLPLQALSKDADPLNSRNANEVYRIGTFAEGTSAMPMYIYHGAQEFWIPIGPARELWRQQCRRGVNASFRLVPGEHLYAAPNGFPDALQWMDDLFRGKSIPNGCKPS